jgi:putative nucleotidyltransferase-like protein
MASDRTSLEDLVATMKRAAAALRDAEVPFMLGGGLAAWARGGPRTDNDVDFFIREEDADRALQALVAAGLRAERPPEEWLVKAFDGDVLVDLIYRPTGGPIDEEFFERAGELEVLGHGLLVASIDDVFVSKLLAVTEQEPDYRAVLELSRALREQIDWELVRTRTAESPFARAFFTLAEALEIVEPDAELREPANAS